jgi:PAS domain S-box-containing protein
METATQQQQASFQDMADFRVALDDHAIVAVTDPQGRITYVNDRFCTISKYSRAELLGQDHQIINSGFHPPEFFQDMWKTISQGRTWHGDVKNKAKDGSFYWVETIIVPFLNEHGKPRQYIAIRTDITRRKEAETGLRDAHAQLQQMLEYSPAVLYVLRLADGQAAPSLVSQNIMALLGFTPAESATRDWWVAHLHPDDRERAIANLVETLATGTSRTEYRLRHRDGHYCWVDDAQRVIRDAAGAPVEVVGVWTDITERKQVEASLQASEKRFKALFEQAAVGVSQADAVTGRFVQVNQRYCDIVGYSREELEQLTIVSITHPLDLAGDLLTSQQMKAGVIREFSREKRYIRKDGSPVWVSLTLSAMWLPGEKPDYVIAVVQDITQRKELEEQVRQAQKMEAIGTLAGGIAHDFNNILAAIVGYTELAGMAVKGNPVMHEYQAAVLQAASRATDLVRQILTFSRKQPPEQHPLQLGPIVSETLQLLRATIPKTIEFDLVLAPEVPTVLADPTQVHQILMNLGTNAWQAMKGRGGRLQVTLERHLVDAAEVASLPRLHPGAYARISVADTGCGMDPAVLRRIFEPFFTTKPPGEGTGLGLAVVHGIMESHDGAITVHSRPGEGTVFQLYFPACAARPPAAAPAPAAPSRGHGEEVLFVDDEEALVELARRSLGALGYRVEGTTQPEVALALVRANPGRFALVITDQTMAGMTGLVLASQLRQCRPALPVLLMTGYVSVTPEELATAGIRQLVLKPMTFHALGEAVHAALAPPAMLALPAAPAAARLPTTEPGI